MVKETNFRENWILRLREFLPNLQNALNFCFCEFSSFLPFAKLSSHKIELLDHLFQEFLVSFIKCETQRYNHNKFFSVSKQLIWIVQLKYYITILDYSVSVNSATFESFERIGTVSNMDLIPLYLAGVFSSFFLFSVACGVVSTSLFRNYLVLLNNIQNFHKDS